MDIDKILVYHYRHNGSPAIKDGLAVISMQQLDVILHNNPDLQCTWKTIPCGATSVEVLQCDLLPPEMAASAAHYPNFNANVAGVNIPLSMWLSTSFTGSDAELAILSKRVS